LQGNNPKLSPDFRLVLEYVMISDSPNMLN